MLAAGTVTAAAATTTEAAAVEVDAIATAQRAGRHGPRAPAVRIIPDDEVEDHEEYYPWWARWTLGFVSLPAVVAFASAQAETWEYAIGSKNGSTHRVKWAWLTFLMFTGSFLLAAYWLYNIRKGCSPPHLHRSSLPSRFTAPRRPAVAIAVSSRSSNGSSRSSSKNRYRQVSNPDEISL
jgi:hypothetical protein